MKFFTRDVYNSWYGDFEDERILMDAYERYSAYLEDLESVLPDHVLELARLEGVHDGLVVEVAHHRSQRALCLTLRCGDLVMGYYDLVLRYEDAEISAEDERTLAQIARTTRSHRRFEHDLFVHEVDTAKDGRIEHRLLFHPHVWFAIRCRVLHWEKVGRPNRDLPRMRDRFPGGPVVVP